MKTIIVSILISVIPVMSFGQNNFRKNQISFETGLYNYGMISLSYSHNFHLGNKAHISSKFAAGVGIGMGDINNYFGGNLTINLGNDNVFFVAGAEIKRYSISVVSHDNDLGDYLFGSLSTKQIEGISIAPVIGVKTIRDSGFTFNLNVSFIDLSKSDRHMALRPAYGIGFGYSF
ncbi:MAG: hypothetical protein IPM77_07865 [Crocinitomicaceae bacterium]|nr:hypothetical protein [Crocinitomicaceae bacterium]